MKRLIVTMITLVGIINFFVPYDKVLADQATSTASIRFVEGKDSSTNPNERNPSQPGGDITLPQTGGKNSTLYYVIGIGLIGLASLLVMKSNMENVKERGN
ncbi:LPXTG cell wall anchor domain-containing protein [Bacillus thuringiensis]|nr:LPXTG cell wall anchor domain-containing protein [Bacillus thuringiensis]